QNIEFNNQEKLEIVSNSVFLSCKQLDHHIKIYAKQNSFVSIIVGSESDSTTHRRCRYACEHQDTNLSNTIYSFKQRNNVINEASNLLETLLNNKEQDPNWVVHWNHLARESMYIRYNSWSNAHVKLTQITASAQLLPEVDTWLAEFLTPPVLSLQRAEIAEALWYSSTLISQESVNINRFQEKSDSGFYKDLDDFPAMTINEVIINLPTLSIQEIWEITHYRGSHKNYIIILENGDHTCTCMRLINRGLFCRHFANVITISKVAAFHILMIPRCWYKDEHYSKPDELLRSQPSITYKNGCAVLTSNSKLDFTFIYPSSGISFNTSKTFNTRRAYGITNGLCKKAMAVGLDAGLTAMETLIIANTVASESQDEESSDDDQENIAPFDVSTVQNPMAKKKKGAPRVKRIKSSLEIKNTQSNTKKEKGTCLCSRCKQPNHYAKTCSVDL
ncbi:23255_t:CDS:2, partial [Gigaspora rosea]